MSGEIALRIDRLRTLREQHGWSQRELARLCGLGEAQVNKYESGQTDPSSTFLKRIAEKLGVSTDYLLGITDEPRGHIGDDQMDENEAMILNTYRQEGWLGVIRFCTDSLAKQFYPKIG